MNKTDEIIEKNTLDIHGKSYLTVAGRLQLMHEGVKRYIISTKVLSHNPVVVKASLTIYDDEDRPIKETTGISAANPGKAIEKQTPYEVAETSAVGRALGFAGYGLIESVASADEMVKATAPAKPMVYDGFSEIDKREVDESLNATVAPEMRCSTCDAPAVQRSGVSKKTGKPWTAIFCSTEDKSHAKFL